MLQDVAAALLAELENCELAGVGQATLWPLLAGKLWPRTDTLLRVAAAAGVHVGVR